VTPESTVAAGPPASPPSSAPHQPLSGLTRKASLNTLASALDYAARAAVGLAVTPFLLAGLGDYVYGVWQIVQRSLGYLSVATGRTPAALKWTIAHQQASNDIREKKASVGSAIAVWGLFLPVVSVAGGVLAWFGPSLLGVPTAIAPAVRVAIALMVANVAVVSLAEIPRSVLGGENLGYKRMGVSTLLVVAGGGFTMLALALDGGLPGVALAQLATTALTGVAFLGVVRAHVPWFGVVRPSFAAARRFFSLSGWFVVWRLVSQLMLATDILVLAALQRAELVTSFTLTKQAADTLIGLGAVVAGGIAPGLGGLIGAGALGKAIRVRGQMMALAWLLATGVGSAVLCWNRSFVTVWVGGQHYEGAIVTLAIVVLLTQLMLIKNDSLVIDLTLDVTRKVLLGLLASALALALGGVFLGVLDLGLTGLCAGIITARLMLTVAYPYIVGRRLGVSLSSQLRGAVRPALTTAALFAVALALGERVGADTWIGLVAGSAATCVATAGIALLVGLPARARRELIGRLRQLAWPGSAPA
jgi:O-antigen/teichoic acid export membrane protein